MWGEPQGLYQEAEFPPKSHCPEKKKEPFNPLILLRPTAGGKATLSPLGPSETHPPNNKEQHEGVAASAQPLGPPLISLCLTVGPESKCGATGPRAHPHP